MKTYTFFLALVLSTTFSISTMFANTLPVEDITIGNTTESITINWDNPTQQTIHVKIIDARQEIIMEETVKNQTDFMKYYPIADLQNGHYNLVITNRSNRITQPFSIENGTLNLSETDRKVKYIPAVSQKNNVFDVSVFLGYSGTITVNLIDEDKNKIFTQTYTNTSILHKRYNLANTAEGNYKVEVIAGDETFYYSIVK